MNTPVARETVQRGYGQRYPRLMTNSQATDAIDTLTRARELAEATVTATADGHEAFRLATALECLPRSGRPDSTTPRTGSATDQGPGSANAAGLADSIGVSTSRANQLVNQGAGGRQP